MRGLFALTVPTVPQALALIFEAYAGALYADDDEEGKPRKDPLLDRAEYIHFLQVVHRLH